MDDLFNCRRGLGVCACVTRAGGSEIDSQPGQGERKKKEKKIRPYNTVRPERNIYLSKKSEISNKSHGKYYVVKYNVDRRSPLSRGKRVRFDS